MWLALELQGAMASVFLQLSLGLRRTMIQSGVKQVPRNQSSRLGFNVLPDAVHLVERQAALMPRGVEHVGELHAHCIGLAYQRNGSIVGLPRGGNRRKDNATIPCLDLELHHWQGLVSVKCIEDIGANSLCYARNIRGGAERTDPRK